MKTIVWAKYGQMRRVKPPIVFFLLLTLFFIGKSASATPASPVQPGGFLLQPADQEKIDAYIESRMRSANIPGLALGAVRGDQVIYLKGYGVAGADGRAVTPQTPFILGSTSKSFTALAVMQLVEAGKIELDAPVTKYLPWFRTADSKASNQITVRQLLNQDSGLGGDEGRQGIADNDQSASALEQGVRQLSAAQLSQPAGEGYEYSNVNYNILGLIVQVVSGKSYEEYVQTEIFDPLKMLHSASTISAPVVKDIASGYRYWFFWPAVFEAPYPRRMTPAGFLISNAEDMSHYLISQLNDGTYDTRQVLSSAGIDTLHTAGPKMSQTSAYGMGWEINTEPGSRKIEHNGDTSNFHSNLLLLPDQQIGIVILTNVNGYGHSLALNVPIEGVAEILLGHDLSVAVDPPATPVTQLMLLVPPVVLILWLTGSAFFIKRWRQQGKLPVRNAQLLWRYFLPLAIDLCLASMAWIIIPRQFQTPMETISLFTPDVYFIIVLMAVLGAGWAMARTYLTFQPRAVDPD